ncbi:MAG TPA: alanine racemase [Nitrospirota bacterium]
MEYSTGRPTRAYIDLKALDHNLAVVRRIAGGRKVLGVVKADAYGHGAVEVSRRLEWAGADMLGVALVEEGFELRHAGIKSHILILGGVFDHQADDIVAAGLTPVVFTMTQARALSDAAVRRSMRLPVHFKVDTGMGRVGLPPEAAASFIREVAGLPGIAPEGIMTHLADVGGQDITFAERQVDLFGGVLDRLAGFGIEFPLAHAAGSAAVMGFKPALFNMVRPGIMLYGCCESACVDEPVELRPVMSVKTAIIHLKRMEAGVPISYGRTYHTKRPSLIATLPIGYADGVSRGLTNKGHVLAGGKRCPVVGAVCMDMIMVDVTDVELVAVGDEAVFIGNQSGEAITAEEVAHTLGTISYEVLCGISKRVPRVYGPA